MALAPKPRPAYRQLIPVIKCSRKRCTEKVKKTLVGQVGRHPSCRDPMVSSRLLPQTRQENFVLQQHRVCAPWLRLARGDSGACVANPLQHPKQTYLDSYHPKSDRPTAVLSVLIGWPQPLGLQQDGMPTAPCRCVLPVSLSSPSSLPPRVTHTSFPPHAALSKPRTRQGWERNTRDEVPGGPRRQGDAVCLRLTWSEAQPPKIMFAPHIPHSHTQTPPFGRN